jgi:hypothetical protein
VQKCETLRQPLLGSIYYIVLRLERFQLPQPLKKQYQIFLFYQLQVSNNLHPRKKNKNKNMKYSNFVVCQKETIQLKLVKADNHHTNWTIFPHIRLKPYLKISFLVIPLYMGNIDIDIWMVVIQITKSY